MELIITSSIAADEYEPLSREISLSILKSAARKASQGLGVSIKNAVTIPKTVLKKLSLTSPGGAARSIFLLRIGDDKTFLVMLRLKNDKRIGENMAIQNPRFASALKKNLIALLDDWDKGRFIRYPL